MDTGFAKTKILTIVALTTTMMLPATGSAQDSRHVKYAKSEVQKAAGKCVASVVLGGILGGVIGGAVDGKKGAARGLGIGAGGGAIVCALIMATAKHKDRIVAAQLAAANGRSGSFVTRFDDDNGRPVQLQMQASPPETIDGARLTPVKYDIAGGQAASPVLDTGGQECRVVSGTMAGAGGAAPLPSQYVCRTPAGDYAPYELGKPSRA